MDIEFKPHDVKFEYNLERIIDDFILFCVLVGNDFLPCLPFAEIGENGLDDLFRVYKDHLASASNSPWLTKNCGEVDFKQFLGKTFPGSFPVAPCTGWIGLVGLKHLSLLTIFGMIISTIYFMRVETTNPCMIEVS